MGRKILSRSQFAVHEPRAAKLRKHCIDFVGKHTKGVKTVYSLLSGGVDSHVCLFAALELGLRPKVLSFTLADRESRDFRTARNTAAHFGLDFEPVVLNPTIDELKRHLWEVNFKYVTDQAINKSAVECTWPMFHALRQMSSNSAFLCGFGGDTPFASSRKAKKMYYAGTLDKEVLAYYTNLRNDAQLSFIDNYQRVHKGIRRPVMPLNDMFMYTLFHGMDPFKLGNKPIQKAPLRLAFWEYFEQVQVYGQQSFQKGDTGISDCFELLLQSDWNTKGYKSVVGIYNDCERQELVYKKS